MFLATILWEQIFDVNFSANGIVPSYIETVSLCKRNNSIQWGNVLTVLLRPYCGPVRVLLYSNGRLSFNVKYQRSESIYNVINITKTFSIYLWESCLFLRSNFSKKTKLSKYILHSTSDKVQFQFFGLSWLKKQVIGKKGRKALWSHKPRVTCVA